MPRWLILARSQCVGNMQFPARTLYSLDQIQGDTNRDDLPSVYAPALLGNIPKAAMPSAALSALISAVPNCPASPGY